MDGNLIVEIARKNMEKFVKEGETIDPDEKELPEYFEEKKGVFVTLKKNGDLRGCIGLPYPDKKFKDALMRASSQSTRDPRFPDLREEELEDVKIEVTVLTKPEEIEITNLEEAEDKIEIGRHGLIIKKGGRSGLLLPQVAPENNFDVKGFLEALCRKAGLPRNSWREKGTKIQRFEAEIFREED